MRSTRYQVPLCTCVLIFLLSFDCPLSILYMPPPPPANCTRAADQNVTPPIRTAQHRAISSAQAVLGIPKSLVTPKHVPFLSAPFHIYCVFPCASVASGVSRLRSGVRVDIFFSHISFIFSALFLSSYPSQHVAQIRGHQAGSYSPLPTTVRAFVFIAGRFQLFIPSQTRIELSLPTLQGILIS